MITFFRILLLLAFWWSIVLHAPKPHNGLLPHVDPRAVIMIIVDTPGQKEFVLK